MKCFLFQFITFGNIYKNCLINKSSSDMITGYNTQLLCGDYDRVEEILQTGELPVPTT